MNAKHARSPVIKVVAGENEVFGDDDPAVPLNVFYVSKSLLIENSTYFNIILDSAPGRAVVFLPEHDFLVVADWLDLLFHDRLDLLQKDTLSFDTTEKYLVFADLVGSEKLKNVVVDTVQANVAQYSIYTLRDLQDNHPSLTVCFDIILEHLAYVVVTEGWAQFMNQTHSQTETGSDQDHGSGRSAWNDFIADKDNLAIVNKLLLKVDALNGEKAQNTLVSPAEREDCKWHEHLSEETKANCPRRGGKKQECT
ncbi:hypothetical protein G647_08794 [Cladophialophora carrionii CBS 160.54]|uniref:BTB domain-containing protein n=1 Tax=Cladophialophora carrionii CBS 160.54 TaxID=1279043 RepID=V9CZF0_9EURO|nr:uncharacterized protein G647_08794 [Cladophialophora carrionii CBS 160.54]ETI19781.1 hypothetical protein G647_08794 [Cladophialophora carrionii CBS 160.54]